MSYRIDYGDKTYTNPNRNLSNFRIPAYTAVFLFAFVLLVRQFWPKGTETLTACLLPVEPGIAQQAFSVFLSSITQGESFRESFAVFCREILLNGC